MPRNFLNLPDVDIEWKDSKMLIVDENKEIQNMFWDMFKKRCLKCDVAATEFDAMRLIELNGAYDVYFIDNKMPKATGLGLEKWIKIRGKELGGTGEIFFISNDRYSPVVSRRE